jgi:hypothetical protein
LNGEEQDQEAEENASMLHVIPARVRRAFLQALGPFPRSVHFEVFQTHFKPLYDSGFHEDSHRTAGVSAAPCTSEAKRDFPRPELPAELNFKGSHKGIDVISLAGIACLARILRPSDLRRQLKEEPGTVKISSI